MSEIRTVLSIGATGSIGRPVVDELLAQDLAVRALVRDVERARRASDQHRAVRVP